ncbi:hypothetical protein CISIN_1g0453401mg, partial [Citrus sinensis]
STKISCIFLSGFCPILAFLGPGCFERCRLIPKHAVQDLI